MQAINRRTLTLAGLGLAGTGLLGTRPGGGQSARAATPPRPAPTATTTAAAPVHRVRLSATVADVDLGGRTVRTWVYDGRLPGREIRLPVGSILVADIANHLPEATSLHWHGIATPLAMDGAPPVTPAAPAGTSFTHHFMVPDPGTYWFHSHVGLQRDRGLYAPLVVEDPDEPLGYDEDWVVVLDDWLDGVTGTPEQALAAMHAGDRPRPESDAFVLRGASSPLLGGTAGEVKYPHYLVDGRLPTAPRTYRSKPGRRVRLRLVNAGADTAFRVALGGHRLTLTHTDGFPVAHEQVDAVLLTPGERYDVLVTLESGVFPLVALAEGRNGSGMALVRTATGTAPGPTVRPAELNGRVLAATALRAAEGAALEPRRPDVVHRVELTGSSVKHDWGFNGHQFDMHHPDEHAFHVRAGQRVRLDFVNTTKIWHPIHLHGHTYQIGRSGPRKDTVMVLPGQKVSCAFDADNPGRWMLHCHNLYHEAGMMSLVDYDS
ncbi:multicopper oxidase family protein [Streptomyces sp. NPDC059740]|uniref:multicopper oxidase family protein n=1 Tax=Streptomyces sp. NPDC059740 TaxID=3346926 RepID=UPI0036472425